ncbi:MAG: hypothetical protein GX879_09665, partial [Bacteroidales bacterium]|nr:hypothetical protein [Bacteroidales bacterium]
MKKTSLLITLIALYISSFAQFGGGSGTEEDPFRLYTKEHLEELSDSSYLQQNIFTGTYFKLMNNINDTITKLCYIFNGNFNGGGHSINVDPVTHYLFKIIDSEGCLDSIKFIGNSKNFISIVQSNSGIIRNCISDVKINHPTQVFEKFGICADNAYIGLIESCVNLADFSNEINPDTGEYDLSFMVGICRMNYGTIKKCTNYGDFSVKGGLVAGIVFENAGTIELCVNNGNIFTTDVIGHEYYGGIVTQTFIPSIIRNCINNGNISVSHHATFNEDNFFLLDGGILAADNGCYAIENCLNTGNIKSFFTENAVYRGGGIVGGYINSEIINCLNIGNNGGGAIIDIQANTAYPINATNNYYDKQTCLSKGINGEDVPGSAEGKLTTQLTGTSPELQAMLGDGWSYAEGRYPIPLGLENDSMALVAATPVYLHFENEDDYNHVDSVSKNFTVGLENNVSWEEAFGRVSFNDENVQLLSIGYEVLSVKLGNYSKKINIIIVDTEVSNP